MRCDALCIPACGWQVAVEPGAAIAWRAVGGMHHGLTRYTHMREWETEFVECGLQTEYEFLDSLGDTVVVVCVCKVSGCVLCAF